MKCRSKMSMSSSRRPACACTGAAPRLQPGSACRQCRDWLALCKDPVGWKTMRPDGFGSRRATARRCAAERMLREAICSGALRPGGPAPLLACAGGPARRFTRRHERSLRPARSPGLPRRPDEVRPGRRPRGGAPPPASRPGEPARTPRFDLSPTTPDVGLFPRRRWLSAFSEVMRTAPHGAFDYGEPRGERVLREALADQLGRTRGVVAAPEQIVVVSGAAQGSICSPGCSHSAAPPRRGRGPFARQPAAAPADQRPRAGPPSGRSRWAAGRRARRGRGDRHAGTPVSDGRSPERRTPTQASGLVAAARRARDRGRLRRGVPYDREPIRALQGLDRDRVVHLGTTSKTLAPAVRLGWVVLPEHLADQAAEIKHLLDVCSAPIEQLTLAQLIRGGEYDRHIRRGRTVYRRRRDALMEALRQQLPELPVEGVAADCTSSCAFLPEGRRSGRRRRGTAWPPRRATVPLQPLEASGSRARGSATAASTRRRYRRRSASSQPRSRPRARP